MIVIDMELPKTCRSCNLSFDAYGSITEGKCAGLRFGVTYMNDRRNPICPIVGEIPDNHGRIIDEKWVELYILKYFPIEFPKEMEKVYKLLKLALEDVPTILEAST